MSRARDKCTPKALIDTLDTGLQIVQRVKSNKPDLETARPLDRLKDTLTEGKKEIQDALDKGTTRFGLDFAQGDRKIRPFAHMVYTDKINEVEAQLELSQIIIEIQETLLYRLIHPHEEDIVDCIDVAERGTKDALSEMLRQHRDRLRQERSKSLRKQEKEETPSVGSSVSQLSQEPTHSESEIETQRVPEKQAIVFTYQQPPPSPPNSKNGGKGWKEMFRRNSSSAAAGSRPLSSSPPSTHPHFPKARSESLREGLTAKRPTNSPRVSADKLPHIAEVRTSKPSSPGRLTSKISGPPSPTPTPILSSEEGTCKYAQILLDQKPDKALERANPSLYSQNWVFQCKSSKCQFRGDAMINRKGHILVDERIRQSGEAEYRWMLLAKSHCRHEGDPELQPYKCLACEQLGDKSLTYIGHEALIDHMVCHAEAQIGNVKFQGPLSFVKDLVIPSKDQFDIIIPPLPPKYQEKRPVPLPGSIVHQQNPMNLPIRPNTRTTLVPSGSQQVTAQPDSQRKPSPTQSQFVTDEVSPTRSATIDSTPIPKTIPTKLGELPKRSSTGPHPTESPTVVYSEEPVSYDIRRVQRSSTINSTHSSFSYEMDPHMNPWQD